MYALCQALYCGLWRQQIVGNLVPPLNTLDSTEETDILVATIEDEKHLVLKCKYMEV